MAEVDPALLRQNRHQVALDLDRILLAGQTEALGDPGHVGIHHHPRGDAEHGPEHHVGGLAADAGKLHQTLQVARDLALVALDHGARHPQQGARFAVEEPGAADHLDQRLRVGLRQRRRIRPASKQLGRDLIDPRIGTLRRQNRGY